MSWRHVFLLPAFLLTLWLVLGETLTAGQMVLGAMLSLFLYWAAGSLRPLHSQPKRPLTILALLIVIIFDIVKSSLEVAALIWRRPKQGLQPRFIHIPLELRDAHGLAMLACILTYIPGTVWAGLSDDYVLTLHVFNLHDPAYWERMVKMRYERPLKEIFE
jgi:multicomponent K+:H+ antiporter subunit E